MRTSRYLWISNLPPDVTEDEIRESLISHGKIHNVKIHEVADSKGAVVAFFDQTGATKAIESANKLDGVILKIEYCDLHGSPGLQRIQQQNQLAQQNCEKNPEWVDERGSRAKSPVDSHRNRSRSSSLSSTRSGRSNLTDVSKHGSSSRRERNYHKSVDHVRRKFDKGDRERDHDENSQESGGDSPLSRFGEMRGLKIFQLPQRSSDSNIKEGLFHELKRFGKITSVEIKGDDPSSRYAVVTFKRAEDAEKAYMKWNDKIYFFTNVIVERHSGTDKEDPSFCQPEQVLNEFHPKSTKTLFVGNLHHEPDSPKAKQELVDTFEEFGSILEIDIKKQPNQSGVAYAFIQYADINSVVRALHKAESIKIGGKPVKLGFGKSQPTQCLWLSNLPSGTTDGFLANHFKRYGPVKYIKLHPQQLRALVYFENVDSAQKALSEQKNRIIAGRKLQADYASQRCQRHLLDQILQLNSFHMRSHPIADALRLAYSHAYMKSTTSYYHYMRNLARYDERSRSRHMEDIDLYDPYVEAGRRGSSISDYEAFSQRRSGGSGAVGSSVSSYPDNVFGIESGNSRGNVSGSSSSVKKCSERNCVKTNGPSSEAHYSRNRSDSPFSSKSSHSRDLRSRSRSPRLDRKHRESTNRSHNRSDSSHSGEGDASADSNCQRVMRHRRSTPRGSHSLSVSVGSENTATRSTVQPNSCVRREHRGTSSNSTSSRTTRIQQRLKSEVKPAVSGSSNRQSSRRMDNASDDEAESDVEAPHVTATATSTSVIPSGHSATGDSSSIHSGGSGGHRSDDATDIGELMAQREKLLREIFEMDGDTSSGISSTINSSSRTTVGDNNRSKAILRELVDSSHLEKMKSRETQLPPDSRKSKESYEDEQPKNQMIGPKQEHDSRDVTTKRRLTDCAIPSRISNGPLSKLVPGIVSSHSAGLSSDACRSPGSKTKVEDGAHKLTNPSKAEDKGLSVETRVSSAQSTSGPATNQHHKLHSQPYDEKFHSNQRTQHSVKSDQCSSNDSLSSHTSDRKLVTSSVTSCVNASRDPRLAPQQYGNRIIGANIPPHLKHLSPKSPAPAPAPGSSFHESSTEQRLTDLLQRFVQPVTAMAPTIAGQIEVNSSQMSTSNDGCSPPPPPPPLPHHGVVPPQVIDPQHSLPKGSTSNKQTVYHDDSSTLADCEDPELKSVMQKTSTIDKQIEELDMKISRSEIARATAPTIDRSKYRIRPRSDSGKVAATVVKPQGGPSTATESPLFSSTVTNDEKPPWKEENSSSNIPEFCETSVSTPSIKSQDTSEFVKSMLMQSSRTNSSFFISNPSASSNSGTIVTSTVSTPTPSFSSPPVSVSPTTNTGTSCSWTSPSLEDAHRSVTVSSTSNSVANRLNSPPIVSYGASNVTNVSVLNKVQSSSYVTPSMTHTVPNVCVVSSLGTSSVTTISSPVTVVSSTPSNRPRFPSVPCCSDNNSDIPSTPSISEDSVMREPRSPEHLKSILKKETPDTKCSQVHTSPTTPKSSHPDNFSMSVKNSHSFPLLNVSSGVGQKSQRSPTGITAKPSVAGNESKSITGQNMKRKHSEEIKKPIKILKLEHESESKLFRPDAFLFANKSDVKKEKRAVDQVKRPLQVTTASEVITDIRSEISPSVDLKSSPQLSNSSHEEFKFRRDESEEKHQRKFSFDENGKKRKNKDKSIESSDTGSKPDDSDDENKHESSKRKRKKKLNRSKEDDQRSNKKGKRKKKKKLDQNQMLKKKTHDKSKEGDEKVKKVKSRKQRIEGKEPFDLSDTIERQMKKEKKEKVDRKCSNDDSFSDDDWTKAVGFKDEGFITMYDFVKTKRKAESAKNQGHHKDKSESKSSRRKSTENFKKSNNIFDSADNSIDESESRASSSKSVSRKSKTKSSKNKRRRQILSNYTSDDSDERDDNSGLINKVSKSGCRFRVNSDEADDETDCEEMRKVSGKTGKKKPDKRKVVDVQLISTKKSKKPKVLSDGKKKVYTEDGLLKKRRKKNALSNNKLDSNDPGKQKMSVASVFSDVDTDSSTGTECRVRYPVKIVPNEESDESQGSEDGLLLTPPKNRLVREQTAASSPTTPSTEPMSDDAVMNDLPLTGLPPFREKHKNPLKEALTSAHEESRKELKELQRESNLIADRHRAIADDEDVEVSEDLPSLEVMISIVKSPSFIDDEPPPITCDDAPTLTTDAEGDDSTSIVEETVIVDHCVDVPIIDDASDKFQSSIEESYCASAVTSRTSSSDDQMGNTDNSKLIESMHISVDSGSSKICDDSPSSCTYDLSRMDVSQQNASDTESEQVMNNQKPDEIDEKCLELDIKKEPNSREVKTEVIDDTCSNEIKQTDEWSKVSLFSTPISPKPELDSFSNTNTDAVSKLTSSTTPKPIGISTVFSAEQPKVVSSDKSSCESLVKSQGTSEFSKSEPEENVDIAKNTNDTGNKVEMVRYVQRIMERVSVDISEDNKGSGKRIKKGTSGLSCPAGSSHPNQNILSSIADRGLSDRKPITTTNPACLLPPGCNIYLEDSKMLPNLPASVTLTGPVINPQPPLSVCGQTSQNSTPVTVISPILKNVTPMTTNASTNRVNNQKSVTGSQITSPLTTTKSATIIDMPRSSNQVGHDTQSIQFANQTSSILTGSSNASDSVGSGKVNPLNSTNDSNSNILGAYSSRRVFTRRKRNSSSNTKSENEREGSWHAHVDEVLEKVVHGKSNTSNTELSKSTQPVNHLAIKLEDQIMQQKETDEAVRAIEISMTQVGSSDSSDIINSEISSLKKDVDPYEPNFDEPSPSEINRNILTHSHHKRQDGNSILPTDAEESRATTPSVRPAFEASLNDVSDKVSTQPAAGTTFKSTLSVDVHGVESDKPRDEQVSPVDDESEDKTDVGKDKLTGVEKETHTEENRSTTKVHNIPKLENEDVNIPDTPLELKCEMKEKESEVNLVKSETSRADDQTVGTVAVKKEMPESVKPSEQELQKLEHQKTPQIKLQVPAVQLQHPPVQQAIPPLQVTQMNLQKQELNSMTAQTCQSQSQSETHPLPQSIFIQSQQPVQAHLQPQTQALQLQHQLQQLQNLQQQQQLKFPHLLQPKSAASNSKHTENILENMSYRLIPSSKVNEVLTSVSETGTTSEATLSKESLAPATSIAAGAAGNTGTRKRTNRAMSQTALIHVEEILDAVAHDKNFDLTQYSKDSSIPRRRSNSGEDHFPQTNVMQQPMKDNPGMFATTDLRVLTPRSANAMVTCKVGAEEQIQVQATLTSQPASVSSVPSKVSIAPHVLEQFLKQGNAAISSQQFQRARPASAVGVSDSNNLNNASLIAAVEPGFQKMALATSFASLSPGASISPALASTGLGNKTIAALATPIQSIETTKIVHPTGTSGNSRHSLQQSSVTPTTQTSSIPSTCNQPFSVAQATATVEDRGHAIERIPNPGLTAVQHHRDQISPRLATASSASPAATNVSMDSKSNSLLNPVTGIVNSAASRPASNPVHLQSNTLSDSAQTSHQARNFLPSGIAFEHNYDFQMQIAAMQQLMRQNTSHFNADGNLIDLISMHYLTMQSPNSAAQHQFWPPSGDQRRDSHNSVANTIITGVPVQGLSTSSLAAKPSTTPDWSPEQLQLLQSKYHMSWKGKLALKNDEVLVQMLFITGNVVLVKNCIRMIAGSLGGSGVPPLQHALKIVQRMRMEQSQLEGVVRKMEEDHCMLLAVPAGEDIPELETQANILNNSFIKYLQEKSAAGIINVNHNESQQPAYVVHIFPPGEFSRQRLSSCSIEPINTCGELPHLLVIITTV